MLAIFLLSFTVDYYYFTADYCAACKTQTPIVVRLNEEGYDFKIKKDEFNRYGITTLPTFVVVVKQNGKPIVTVKMMNRHWSRRELKTLVNTVKILTL